jgi:hypothetical protein
VHPLGRSRRHQALFDGGCACSSTSRYCPSVAEVARRLAVSTAIVYGLCGSGKLAHVRLLNVIRVRVRGSTCLHREGGRDWPIRLAAKVVAASQFKVPTSRWLTDDRCRTTDFADPQAPRHTD